MSKKRGRDGAQVKTTGARWDLSVNLRQKSMPPYFHPLPPQ
jgi:hypothetical protein